ncbi:astacin-like metalloendopeptidase isoform X1 [Hemitrygon akajei]|uniref:astacin-like metalloendopeptidase isoform X1 n=3 Tax=Hemitrygon akajei TaxID=2704970 RepID=UPI003BF94383
MDSSCGMWRLLWFSLALVQEGQSEVKGPDSKSQLVATQTKTVLPEGAIVRMNQSFLQRGMHVRSFSIEGDIIKPLRQNIVTYQTQTWLKSPDGVVRIPYEISPQYDEQTQREIGRGFKEFERFTCIRFVPHTDEEDFISLRPVPGCSASVGRVGGTQLISLNRRCLEKGKGVIEHELMHSLGFWHEHTRSDRDKYIKIEWKNVWPGYEHNFLKKNTNNLKSGYDYGSILHYSRTAFSRNGQPTLTPLVDTDAVIGQRVRLSEMDLLKVNRLYNCTAYLEDKADTVKCKGKRNQWL